MDFLKGRTEDEKTQPFFAYLAYLAPHWPIQAPRDVSDGYKGWYDGGPRDLAAKRVKKLIELGLVPPDVVPAPMEKYADPREWETLSEQERKESARKMEVYAAMVEMIDQGVGEVMDYLDSVGELDNTFIAFISDNGAEGLMMEALATMGSETTMADIISAYYDNSLENIGNRDSFVWYGPQWASAATAPSRGWKTWPTEGGIRCPCIVCYPPFNNKPAAVTHSFTTAMDLLPTILELAEVPLPNGTFQGRDIVPVRGKSWVPHLSSSNYNTTAVHDKDAHVHGWELIGLRAIRRGPYKALWMHPPRGRGEWELYNVEKDPSEMNDMAKSEPELMKEMMRHWEWYYSETGMFEYPFEFGVAKA